MKSESQNRAFDPWVELLPENFEDYPLYFSEEKLKLMQGTTIQRDIEEIKEYLE